MTLNKLSELLFELTTDVDAVDMKMKKVTFPVDENNFADDNFLRLYSKNQPNSFQNVHW